jgi:SAM-dependent methyltransferase
MSSELKSGYSEWKGWQAGDFGIVDSYSAQYFAGEMRACGCSVLHGQAVLELGFGNGVFAAWAISQGAHYRGTEIIPELILRARQAGVEAFDARSPIESVANANTVDLAIAFDVFEHIEITELRTIMRSLHLCLKPGGILLGRVPSGDSPFANLAVWLDLR